MHTAESCQLNNNPYHSDWHHLLFLANHITSYCIIATQLPLYFHAIQVNQLYHPHNSLNYELDRSLPGLRTSETSALEYYYLIVYPSFLSHPTSCIITDGQCWIVIYKC